MTVVVDPVERHPNWAFAHVRQKVLKFEPPATNSDPSSTVSSVVVRLRIPTAP